MINQSQQPQPFFSIIIPAYNVENYIRESIESVLNQSFQNFELIIVNDGSVDNTTAIINEYAKNDTNVIVINHTINESLHISRMDGINFANGRYIIFLDADDYFVDGAFNFLSTTIQNNQGFDFYEFAYIKRPSGDIVFPWTSENNRFFSYLQETDSAPPPTMWNKVYDTFFIKKCLLFFERIYLNNVEDTYESVIISYFIKRTYRIKKTVINYRIGIGISTSGRDYLKIKILLESIRTLNILIKNFLKRIEQNINFDNLNYRLLDYTINDIVRQESKKEKYNLFMSLKDYFNLDVILSLFSFREELWREALLNSISYRIGHFILFPLRLVKKYLIKIQNKLWCYK